MANINFTLTRGDSAIFEVAISDSGGQTNLTGGVLRFTAKYKVEDLDNAAVIVKTSPSSGITITDVTHGKVEVTFMPADTASFPARSIHLVYDLQLTLGAAVYTVAKGNLIVEADVSITVP